MASYGSYTLDLDHGESQPLCIMSLLAILLQPWLLFLLLKKVLDLVLGRVPCLVMAQLMTILPSNFIPTSRAPATFLFFGWLSNDVYEHAFDKGTLPVFSNGHCQREPAATAMVCSDTHAVLCGVTDCARLFLGTQLLVTNVKRDNDGQTVQSALDPESWNLLLIQVSSQLITPSLEILPTDAPT